MFLTVIVLGPKIPKQKLDVYLQSLIAELKSLWLHGVYKYDAWRKQNFVMRASILWTISDFPAYSMLSGMFDLVRYVLDLLFIYKHAHTYIYIFIALNRYMFM